MTTERQSYIPSPLPPYEHTALHEPIYKQVIRFAEQSHPHFRFIEEDLTSPQGFARKMFEQIMIFDEPQVLFVAFPFSEKEYDARLKAVSEVSEANRTTLSLLAKETIAGMIIGCEEFKRLSLIGEIKSHVPIVESVIEDFREPVHSLVDVEERARVVFGDLEHKGKLEELLTQMPEAAEGLYGWEVLADLFRIYGNEFHNLLPAAHN